MKKCTFHFTCILSLLCLVLLLVTWHFYPHEGDELVERILKSRAPTTPSSGGIPVIVVHSTRMDVDKRCHQYHDPIRDVEAEVVSEVWQKTTVDKSVGLFVYSMHVDRRLASDNYLRVLAMSEGRLSSGTRVFCKVWFKGETTLAVEADVDELWVRLWDSPDPKDYFRPLMLSCPFPKRTPPVVAASLLPEPCVLPTNVFFFNKTTTKTPKPEGFAICLKPLDFGGQDITARLLEWLELQFLLGVDHVTIYVTRRLTHPNVLKVLDHYRESGKVTLKSYVSPSGDDSDYSSRLWQKRRHEMLVYNDCFYGHVATRKWVVNLDLDEAIVPLQDDTWEALMDRLAKENPKVLKSASVSAPNVYFFDRFGVMDQGDDVPVYFHMLKHLYRSSNFTPPGFAQKSFCSTKLAHIVTHHYALKGLYPFLHLSVPGGREHLQMHHYRASCPRDMDQECEDNYMKFLERDRALFRFKDALVSRVEGKIKEINVSVAAS